MCVCVCRRAVKVFFFFSSKGEETSESRRKGCDINSACVHHSSLQNVKMGQFKSRQGTVPSGHSVQVVQTASSKTSL